MPPGAKRTPFAASHSTAFARSSIHRPTWFSGVVWTAGFLSGSSGCIRSTSTLNAPRPIAQMSSSTFSRSLTKLPVMSRPSLSTQSVRKRSLLGPPMAICWMQRTLKGRKVMMTSNAVEPLGGRSEATGGPSLERNDHLIDRQALALLRDHLAHDAILRGEQDVLHLHRLDDRELFAGKHLLAGCDRDVDQQSRHWRQQELRQVGRRLQRHQGIELGGTWREDFGVDARAVVHHPIGQSDTLDLCAKRLAVAAAADHQVAQRGVELDAVSALTRGDIEGLVDHLHLDRQLPGRPARLRGDDDEVFA